MRVPLLPGCIVAAVTNRAEVQGYKWSARALGRHGTGPAWHWAAGIQVVSAGTSEAEIAAMMNLGSHGLTAGVYSADRDFARRILRQLDVGTVYATPIRCE